MIRRHFCYSVSPKGEVLFVRDVDTNVKLFDDASVEAETKKRECMSACVTHTGKPGEDYFCYWSQRNGSVAFALGVDKNVQLFSQEVTETIEGYFFAKVGRIGIDQLGNTTN